MFQKLDVIPLFSVLRFISANFLGFGAIYSYYVDFIYFGDLKALVPRNEVVTC